MGTRRMEKREKGGAALDLKAVTSAGLCFCRQNLLNQQLVMLRKRSNLQAGDVSLVFTLLCTAAPALVQEAGSLIVPTENLVWILIFLGSRHFLTFYIVKWSVWGGLLRAQGRPFRVPSLPVG